MNKKDKEESPLMMGEACHIVAASKNGPRGNAALSDEERKGEDNGIWLCQIHADLIDKNNGNGFSVEDLLKMKKSHEDYIREALIQGRCEYLSYQNGGTLTISNDFSYPDNMYEEIVLEIYKEEDLTESQIEESISDFKAEMSFWAKEPIEYRQLAGIAFQYGTLSKRPSLKDSIQIPCKKLARYMKANQGLISEFIAEILQPVPPVGGFEEGDLDNPFECPATVYLYSDTLCGLKRMHPDFLFQNLFMYGKINF